MRTDWTRACRAAGMTIEGDFVEVPLGQEGKHRVRVVEEEKVVRLTAVVLRASATESVEELEEAVLDRNRSARLLGYRLDDRMRLVGEAVLPTVGLEGDELAYRLKVLAADCNRFEYALTGRDVE